jgi:hypothetical protein
MPAPLPQIPSWYDDDYEDEDYLRGCSVQRLGGQEPHEHAFDAPSGVHRVRDLAEDPLPDHEVLYSQIASEWLAPANDRDLAREVLGALGSLERVASIGSFTRARSSAEVDHRRAFILDLVDGQKTLSDIVVASSLPPPLALETLADLIDEGALTLR